MATGKILDDIDALHLPEHVIQRIQGFLPRKEAASTIVLSKSWYNAWLTRPVLSFDERDFPSDAQFMDFVMTSMERYNRLNLNIESFTLWITVLDIYAYSRPTELIVKALKMGAIDFNLEFNPPISEYILPKELFESEFLVKLSVVGGRISRGDVMCSQLNSLSLYRVRIGDAMIRRIISNCPWLEALFFSDCDGFEEVKVGRLFNLKSLSVIRVANAPTSWRVPLIEFESVVDQPYVCGYGRLSSFLLERVKIDKMFFCDFSSKFPCVKDLTVRYCNGCVKYDISSHSINYISLAHVEKLEIQLDVPNICKFKFSGATRIPSLCVVSASKEWESDITLSCWRNIRFWWFLELNKFLSKLSTSKITLGIELVKLTEIEHLPDIRAHCKPMVENLTLGVSSFTPDCGCDALLDGICWSFRPKIVTLCLFPMNEREKSSNELLLFLSKKFINCHEIGNGLEEVNAKICEDMHKEWQPLPLEILFDASIRFEKEAQIRFHLKWRPC